MPILGGNVRHRADRVQHASFSSRGSRLVRRAILRAPTPTQARAWPAIKAGRDTLIAAPTGSGKTLSAFLAAIDELVRRGLAGALPDETQVVYVSPLKALSNDIQKNLDVASWPASARRCGPRSCRTSKSALGCEPGTPRSPNATARAAGRRISS